MNKGCANVVHRQGYHSGAGLAQMSESVRTYVSVSNNHGATGEGKAEQQSGGVRQPAARGRRARQELIAAAGELLERPSRINIGPARCGDCTCAAGATSPSECCCRPRRFNLALILAIHHESRNAQKAWRTLKRNIVLAYCEFWLLFRRSARRSRHTEIFSDHSLPRSESAGHSKPKIQPHQKLGVLTRALKAGTETFGLQAFERRQDAFRRANRGPPETGISRCPAELGNNTT